MKIEEYELSPNCPYCGQNIQMMTSEQFYGKDYGNSVYYCPSCRARTSTHNGTDKPKGRLADERLRRLRMTAHGLFDPMWKEKTHFKSRREAMQWLKTVSCGHFAWMDKQEIVRVIERLNEMKDSE